MMRVIVTPAVLPPSALAELKQWLGISTTLDDAELSALLAMALDVCADFIGFLPLACDVEETVGLRALPHPVDWQVRRYQHEWLTAGTLGGWHSLTSRPVLQVAGVAALLPDQTRVAIAPDGYEVRLDAEGGCRIRVNDTNDYTRAVVSFSAGMAPDAGLGGGGCLAACLGHGAVASVPADAAGMITATPQPSWDTLTAQLAQAAAVLAQAQVEEEARAAADDPSRWRDAGLLWPDMNLDTKG